MAETVLFGGSGFLGPIILERYPQIVSIGRTPLPSDLANRHVQLPSLDELALLDRLEIDRVIFLIGNSNHHRLNQSPSTVAIDYNVIPLMKALTYFQRRRLKKFIAFTGALMYDAQEVAKPVDETHPINPYRNNYLFSKYLAEETAKLFAAAVPTITVRLGNIYGPTRLIRPDLVPTLIQSALSPQETTVWNTSPIRDFIYAADAAEAIVKLLDTDYTGILNLGSGTMNSVGSIVKIVERLSGKPIRDLQNPVSGPMRFCLDISRVNQLTGWRPRHSLEEGLTETFERMRSWADECRWWERKSADADFLVRR